MGRTCSFNGNDIWRTIAVAAIVMVVAALIAVAQSDGSDGILSGKCGDDLTWELDGGNLTIFGSGAMYDYEYPNCGPWGNGIKLVSFEGSVTSIGNYAFHECKLSASVSIPDSVTSIGIWAFYNCKFLPSVSIPDSVTSIGTEAFRACASMKSVSIPDSVTSIGQQVFANCTSLKSVSIPDSVTSIGYMAFVNCTSLASLDIPDSVTIIGEYAFAGCTSLSSVSIPDSVRSINNAFSRIRFLDESGKNLPHTSEGLRGFSYEGHDGVLMRVTDSTIVSGGLVFKLDRSSGTDAVLIGYSEQMAHLVVPAAISYAGKDYAVSSIGPMAFYGLAELVYADLGSVSEIGMKAFARCPSLESVSFGDSLKSVGSYAFFGCDSLVSISIPGSVTDIGRSAFSGCISLTSVAIPASVSAIGDNAFFGIRFLDEKGCVLERSVASLSGSAFEGRCCVLKRVADGFTFVSDGLVFKVDWSGDKDATLVGFSEPIAHLTVPASVSYGGNDYPVSEIGPKAFYGLAELVSADLGSVSEIGMKAFARCAALESVSFGDALEEIGLYAFYGCDSLTSAPIPDSVVSIGGCAFSFCRSLGGVAISDSVEIIGDRAFYGCTSLSSVSIPDSVTSIGDGTFYGCTSLSSVYIPDSVNIIGSQAFQKCSSLSSVSIPDSVKIIEWAAFYDCTSLSSVAIGSLVERIDNQVFHGCNSLSSVNIPGSLKKMGQAFPGIKFLGESGKELSHDPQVLRGFSYEGHGGVLMRVTGISFVSDGLVFKLDSGDKDVTLIGFSEPMANLAVPAMVSYGGEEYSVSSIGPAFNGCTSLSSISIPDSVTSIGFCAFNGCTSLSSISIPDSVTRIGDNAFAFCDSLTAADIGSSVTSIGTWAFYCCRSLVSVSIPDSVIYIGTEAFQPLNFFDENGNMLLKKAEALAGYLYEGDGDGRLFRVMA